MIPRNINVTHVIDNANRQRRVVASPPPPCLQAYSLIISGGSLNVTSITSVETFDESLFGETNLPTSAPTNSPTPVPEPPRLSVDGTIVRKM